MSRAAAPSGRGWRLRHKLVVLIALPASAVTIGVLAFSAKQDVERQIAGVAGNARAVMRAISQDFERMDLLDDQRVAADAVQRIGSFADVRSLHVFDLRGELVFRYVAPGMEGLEPPPPTSARSEERVAGDVLTVETALLSEDRPFATASMQVSLESLRRTLRDDLVLTGMAGATALGIGWLAAFLLQGWISRPVSRLRAAAVRVAEDGDYSVRVERESSDEIGDLANAFDAMLVEIRSRDADLRKAHDELEERVRERTANLVEANTKLALVIREREHAEEERRRIEVRLRHAQKMEAIGQLAAGIAHEINTPTQFISDNTRFLKDSFVEISEILRLYVDLVASATEGNLTPELTDSARSAAERADLGFLREEIPTALEQSLEGLEHVARIVRAMKDFARSSSGAKSPSDLNSGISSTVIVTRGEWRDVAEVELDLKADLPHVECYPTDINQVVLSLLVNAAQAIREAGSESGEKKRIAVTTRVEGDEVLITVRDEGPGIPADVLPRVFEPFFTTKPVGRGTGQGLSIAYGIVVDKHGGAIDVESEVGQGTIFTVRLPVKAVESGRSAA